MTEDDEHVLRVGYRARPETVAELAGLVGLGPDALDAALDRLAKKSRVVRAGESLIWTHPAAEASERGRALLADVAAAAQTLERLLGDLPARVRDWQAGEQGAHESVHARLYTGSEVVDRLWPDLFAAGSPRSICVAASSVAMIRLFGIPDFAAADSDIREHAIDCRLVIGAPPEEAGAVAVEAAPLVVSSVSARVGAPLRSWFLVLDDTVALPLEWGSARFDGVLVVENPSLASVARELFEQLWRSGTSLDASVRTWEPLLDLLLTGVTIQTAGRLLGIAERTARRRVSDAMAHFGVESLFALGAVWERTRERS